MKFIKGDFFFNGLISSSSEVTAFLVSGYLLNKYGLKKVLIYSYFLSAIGMTCLIFTTTKSVPLLMLFVLGSKYGIS